MHESVLRINKLQLFTFLLLELSILASGLEGPDFLPLVLCITATAEKGPEGMTPSVFCCQHGVLLYISPPEDLAGGT